MEINFRNDFTNKIIDLNKSIVSIHSNEKTILNNLKSDYDVVEIDNLNMFFISDNVLNEISLYSIFPELNIVSDAMQIIGLNHDFFDRKISTLSYTDKIFLNIFRNIAKQCDIVLFNNIFYGLDHNCRKKIIKLINYLKDNSYCIIICSDDVNDLYRYSDYVLIDNNEDIKYGKSDELFIDIDTLNKFKLKVPTLPYITYKAKKEKNIKLFYSKDVRDIIKDIYKHV